MTRHDAAQDASADGALAANVLRQVRIWNRLYARLTALYAFALLVALSGLAVAFYFVGVRAETDSLRQRLRALATAAAYSLDGDAILHAADQPEGVVRADVEARLGRLLAAEEQVSSIYVLLSTGQPAQFRFFADQSRGTVAEGDWGELYDASNVPMMVQGLVEPSVERAPVGDEFGLSISGYAPVETRSGEVIGVVGVDVDASQLLALKKRIFWLMAGGFSISLVLMVGAAAGVSRTVDGPLKRLIAASTAIARGRLDTRVDLHRSDEFGVLGRHFDQMAIGLEERERIRATFGRYVSEDVARTLLASPEAMRLGGEEREVTILFSDLRSYSTISEQLSPSQVVELVNAYLGAMNAVIDEHSGCVIEFLGDGILAVFGAPAPLPDHAEHAVRCAIAMQTQLAALNHTWEASGLADLWKSSGVPRLVARIGIHTGTVVAGNLGSQTRMKYAVIGDTVNVAARLEALNKDLESNILISEAVRERCSEAYAFRAVDRGEHYVKGRATPLRVYAV